MRLKQALFFVIMQIVIIMVCILFAQQIKNRYAEQVISFIGAVSLKEGEINQDVMDYLVKGKIEEKNLSKGYIILNQAGYKESGMSRIASSIEKEILFAAALIEILFVLCMVHFYIVNKGQSVFMRKCVEWISHPDKYVYDEEMYIEEDFQRRELAEAIRQFILETNQKEAMLYLEKEKTVAFMQDVSHQMKTPLTLMRIALEKQCYKDEENIHKCLKQIDKMTFMIKELLKLGKLEAGKIEMKIAAVNMGDFFETIYNEMSILADANHVRIDIVGDSKDVWWFDYSLLSQAIGNILKNAIEFAQEDSSVNVCYNKEDKLCTVKITNQGNLGYIRNQQERLFERFETGEYVKEDSSGLGLAIAKEIVKSHFGDIIIAKNQGEQTSVQIHFPILGGSDVYEQDT